jgi:ribosome-binding protein aMBF1 (putative translation factor)
LIALITRDARQTKRLTQQELAHRVGCSESQIARIETGRAINPARWLKEALARELEIKSWEVGL